MLEGKELYKRIISEGIIINETTWNFIYHRINDNITAVLLICQRWLKNQEAMPTQEAWKILARTKEIKNIVSFIISPSKNSLDFPQLQDEIPLNPVIRELIAHQFGIDIYTIELILQNAIDTANLTPISLENVQKVINHAQAIKEFIERMKDVAQWRVAEEKYYTLYDSFKDGLILIDMKGNILDANQAYLDMLGYNKEEIKKLTPFQLTPEQWRKNDEDIASELLINRGYSGEYEKECIKKDGTVFSIAISLWLIKSKLGEPLGMWGTVRDITNHKKKEKESLGELLDSYAVINKISDGITVSDARGHFEVFNAKIREITGYTVDEANQVSDFNALIHPESKDQQEILKSLSEITKENKNQETEIVIRAKDGSKKTLLVSTSLIHYKDQEMFLSVWRDITERKHLEVEREELNKKLKQLVLKDSHTGLYNHHYLKEALEINFSHAERQSGLLAVMMMDLDYFKSINDVYGHIFGDLILKQFATLLTKTVRPYDVVIRYGGEEFIIISPDTGRDGALILANRILEKTQLYNFGDETNSIKLKLSIAISAYPEDNARNGMELVDLADQILNKAKENGGNRVFSSVDIKKEAEKTPESSDVHLLKDKINKLTLRANQSLVEETFAFAKTIELKDHYTIEHSERTVRYAVGISEELNLPQETIKLIEQAAMLHDLGKVGISEQILRKKSKLSRIEFEEIKKHPQIGVDIIRPIHSLHPIIPALLYHHERWDGKGYPYGFKKEKIPLLARIIAIADVYEALVSDRSYRKAYSKEKAVEIVKNGSGTQFDPNIVNSFLKVLEEER